MKREKLKKMPILLLAVIVCLQGCATTASFQDIRDQASLINQDDGISHEEAILIGQDFLLRRGIYDRLVSIKPFRIWLEVVWDKDGEKIILAEDPPDNFQPDVERTWIILWKDKNNTFFSFFPLIPFYMEIDADTGEVKEWGLRD